MIIKSFINFLKYISISVFFSIFIILILNALSQNFLNKNPNILMSQEELINENFKEVRKKLIPHDKIIEYYELSNPEEVDSLWDEFYSVPPIFESYTHFRSQSFNGKYYGVTKEGYRSVKNQGPWPLDDSFYNIFFFGGSTSFGVGPYWATVASYLQEELDSLKINKKNIKIYNFGRSGYQVSQESILLQRLLSKGNKPDAVIFLDFLNDFCFSDGLPSSSNFLGSYFNKYHEQYLFDLDNRVKTKWNYLTEFIQSLPLLKLMNAFISKFKRNELPNYNSKEIKNFNEKPESNEILNNVINRYLIIKKQIEGIGEKLNFKSIFVVQPVPVYNYDRTYHLFNPDKLGCHVNSLYGFPILKEKFLNLDPSEKVNWVWAADLQIDKKENLYVDTFHYTAKFSREIAELISDEIIKKELLSPN